MAKTISCISKLSILCVKAYKLCLSPYIGMHCRRWPTCSSYAIEALTRFGVLLGGWLILKRLLCCNPWCAGGHDPVPKNYKFKFTNER